MKKSIFHFIGIVLKVISPFLLYLIIDFLIEITGGNLGDYLQRHFGITRKVLFIFLVVFLLISLFHQIYKTLNEENVKSLSNNPQNIQLNVENLFDYIEDQYKEKYGKQVEVKLNVDIDEETTLNEHSDFVRSKKHDGIKVFPSERVYARLITEISDWRKEFTVRYPIIEGIKSESVTHKINSVLNYEKVFDVSLIESIEGDTWLSELDYKINFFQKPFLDLTLFMEGIGAYPWNTFQNITVNYETGKQIKITDLFKEESLERLASVVNEFVQIDLRKANLEENYYDEIPLNPELKSEEVESRINWLEERFGHEKVSVDDLNSFSLDGNGITFIHNFGFPHVIKALEPEGQYYFEYSSLKQFIKKDSVLEVFIRQNLPLMFNGD